MQQDDNIRDSVFVKSYLVGLAAGLVLWPVLGPWLAAQIGIMLFWGLQLLLLIINCVSNKAWVRLIVEFLPPAVLWLLFGCGGILALLKVEQWDLYGAYEDFTVVLTTIFMLLGSYAYLLGIRVALGKKAKISQEYHHSSTGSARLLLMVILAIDWSVRIHKNLSGVYVTWIAQTAFFTKIERGITNPYYQLQADIGFVAIPLLVFLSLEDRLKWVFRLLLVIQYMLIFLQGNRSELLFSLITGLLSFALLRGVQLNRKVVTRALVLGVIFFGVISPVIQEARLQMRQDAKSLVEQKVTIPVKFVSVYVRDAAAVDTLLDDSLQGSLVARMGGFGFYAAAIHQAVLDQRAGLLFDDLFPTLMQITPRALFPNKGERDSNYMLQSHFGVGRPGMDAHGTPVVDIFAYAYVFGIMALMFICGLGFGLVVRYLTKEHGLLGALVAVGMIPTLIPIGDSFIGYLAGLRNVILWLIIIFVVDFAYTILATERSLESKSVEPINVP